MLTVHSPSKDHSNNRDVVALLKIIQSEMASQTIAFKEFNAMVVNLIQKSIENDPKLDPGTAKGQNPSIEKSPSLKSPTDTQQNIIDYVRGHPGAEAKEIARAAEVSEGHLRRVIARLRPEGIINKRGSGYRYVIRK